MTNDTVCDVSTITRIGHTEAMAMSAVENAKFRGQLRTLDKVA